MGGGWCTPFLPVACPACYIKELTPDFFIKLQQRRMEATPQAGLPHPFFVVVVHQQLGLSRFRVIESCRFLNLLFVQLAWCCCLLGQGASSREKHPDTRFIPPKLLSVCISIPPFSSFLSVHFYWCHLTAHVIVNVFGCSFHFSLKMPKSLPCDILAG